MRRLRGFGEGGTPTGIGTEEAPLSDFAKRARRLRPEIREVEESTPADFETKREILRRLSGGNVSRGGLELDFDPKHPEYRRQVEMEIARDFPGLQSMSQAQAVLESMPEATLGEQGIALAGRVAAGAQAMTGGLSRVLLGKGGPVAALAGEEAAAKGLKVSEGIVDPSRATLGEDRHNAALAALYSTPLGRTAAAGAELVGAVLPIKGAAGALTRSRVAGSATATPGAIAAYGAAADADGDPLAAAGAGALFGGLAHGISAPLAKWLGGLPVASQKVAQQVLGRGTGIASFAGAGEVLAGLEGEELLEAERILSNAIFGGLMGGKVRPHGRALRSRAEVEAEPATRPPEEIARVARRPEATAFEAREGEIRPEAGAESPAPERARSATEKPQPEVRPEAPVEKPAEPVPVQEQIPKHLRYDQGPSFREIVGRDRRPIDRPLEEGEVVLEPKGRPVEAGEDIPSGTRVRVTSGLFKGETGTVIERQGRVWGVKLDGDPARTQTDFSPREIEITDRASAGPALASGASTPPTRGGLPEQAPAFRAAMEADRPRSPEAGFAAIGDVAGPVVEAVGQVGRVPASLFGSVLGRIRSTGPTGRAVERSLRKAERLTVQEERAALRRPYEAAAEAAADPKNKAAFNELSEPLWVRGKGYAYSALEMTAEGAHRPKGATDSIVKPLMDFVFQRGQRAVAAGVPGFKNNRGILPRVTTGEMHGILREGTQGKHWNALVNAVADHITPKRGQTARQAAEAWLIEAKAAFETGGPPGVERKAQFEFTREMKRFPAFLRSNGTVIQLLHTNPSVVARSLYERGTARLGFGRVFGWPHDASGQTRTMSNLRERFVAEGGSGRLFDKAMRGAQGAPLEQPVQILDADAAPIARATQSISQLYKSAVLSGAWKAAVFEPMGPIADVVGSPRMASSYADAVRSAFGERWLGRKPSAEVQELRDMGLIEKRVPQRNLDPNRRATAVVDRVAEVIREVGLIGPASRVTNERAAALGVWRLVQRKLMTGKGSAKDRMSLEVYGQYTRAEATRLAEGKGTRAEYEEATRRVVDNLVASAGQSALHRGQIESNQIFRLVPFTRYATTQLRTEARWLKRAFQSDSPGDFINWAKGYARHVAGRTTQAIAWQTIVHLLRGGDMEQLVRRYAENPSEEFFAAWLSASMAGSYGSMAYAFMSSQSDSVGDAAINAIWGLSLAKDLAETATGTGSKSHLNLTERMVSHLRRYTPMARDALAFLEATGLAGEAGEDRNDLYQAESAFRRFRYGPFPRGYSPPRDFGQRMTAEEREARKQFQISMRRVSKAMKRFAPKEEILEELKKAVGAKDARAVRSSLLQRRIMANRDSPIGKLSDDERESIKAGLEGGPLKGGLTKGHIESILRFDRRLTSIANWVHSPSKSRRKRRRSR